MSTSIRMLNFLDEKKILKTFQVTFLSTDSIAAMGNILNVSDDACQVRYDLNLTQWCLRFYNLQQFTVFDSFSHPLPTMSMFVYFL